jgi:hypothetical protein
MSHQNNSRLPFPIPYSFTPQVPIPSTSTSFVNVTLQASPPLAGFGVIPAIQSTYDHLTQPSQDANIYVSNLPDDSDDALLYRLFGPFGAVISVAIRQNPQGKIGFCRMARVDDAWNAIQSLNGQKLSSEDHKSLFVQFKKEKKRN